MVIQFCYFDHGNLTVIIHIILNNYNYIPSRNLQKCNMLPCVWIGLHLYIPLPPLFFLSPLHRISLALFFILYIFLIAFLQISFYSSEDQHSTTSFRENLDAITRFSSFRELATLYYGDGPMTSNSIVSSIEFDKDGEFFAVGGVTRKIKVCE